MPRRGGGIDDEGLDALVWAEEADSEALASFVYMLDISEVSLPADLIAQTNPAGEWKSRTAQGVKVFLSPYLEEDHTLVAISPDWRSRIETSAVPDEFDDMQALVVVVDSSTLNPLHTYNLTENFPDVRMVRGILYNPVRSTVFVSHLYVDSNCTGLEVVEFQLADESLRFTGGESVFRTEPCLDFIVSAHQHGGALAVTATGDVLVTVGDFGYGLSYQDGQRGLDDWDGTGRPPALAEGSTFGTTVKISETGWEIFTSGHRNQQGLTVDLLSGEIWASEHGPRGGGELNLLKEARDYGWPEVTYGRPYDRDPIPQDDWEVGDPWAGLHEGFEKPLLTWVPSIAPSALVVYRGDTFPGWEGDILLGTLHDQSIRRIRVQDDRVIFDERIHIGHRVRDVLVDREGALIIATDDANLLKITLAPRVEKGSDE